MAGITDTISSVTGGINLGGIFTGITQGVTIIFGFIVVAIMLAILGYFYWNNKRYSRNIEIVKKVGGGFIRVGKDRARIVKIGDMGNEMLSLKKLKVFRASSGKVIDNKNTYMFVIDKEGNWNNVGFSDIDKQLKEIYFEIPSNDQRLANVSTRRLNEKQFEQQKWWRENVALIAGGMILVIIVIFLWLMASKYFTIFDTQKTILDSQNKLNQENTKTVDAMTKLAEAISNMINKGGASFQPALTPIPAV